MSAELYAGLNAIELGRLLTQKIAEIASTEKKIAVLEAISNQAGHTYLNSQNAKLLSQLRSKLEMAKNARTALETAKNARTALTLAQTTEAALTEGAATGGLASRLSSLARFVGYTGSRATLVGGATATAGLAAAGVLTYFLACGLGALAADSSVQAGRNGRYIANREEVAPRAGFETVRDAEQSWQIVMVPGMGGFGGKGIYSIRTVEDVKRGIAYGDFRHGGNSGDPVPNLKPISGPLTRDQAAAKLGSMITGPLRKPPLAGGLWGKIGEDLCTIDDYGPVSVSEIQKHIKE